MKRCEWAENQPKFYQDYHDKEWGTPQHKDKLLFELLILEGAQAGLSWITILKKRNNYKKAFNNFNPKIISQYNEEKVQELLQNEGIIRNKLKIRSTIQNAKVFLQIQKEFKSFNNYIWSFTNNKQIINHPKTIKEIPTKTPLSDQISKDLKKRGMSFVGTTIIYSYLQAIGVINDHTMDCFKSKVTKTNK
ncbi:MAG: DNA-3-methyladenine glycosylase I [Candidatus Nanoarchaeia archaeon]|nr:DNA-3-methyladenine glycosylase I [Candidatus Nanoarchaeia archaeon]